MSVQFVIGTLSSDATNQLHDTMREILHSDPSARIYYIVPEHIKFEREKQMLEELGESSTFHEGQKGMMRLQVTGFQRLAWLFLREEGHTPGLALSSIGQTMYLKKIMRDLDAELSIFRGERTKTGFLERMTDFLEQLMHADIEPEHLLAAVEKKDAGYQFQDYERKLHDIHLIYDRYSKEMRALENWKPPIMKQLIRALETRDLSGTYVFFDGFESFNAQELIVAGIFMRKAAHLCIRLMMDGPSRSAAESGLFIKSGILYRQLHLLAGEVGARLERDRLVEERDERYQPPFDDIGSDWIRLQSFRSVLKVSDETKFSVSKVLHIQKCKSMQQELEQVSARIHRLVVEEGYRYHDFYILCPNLSGYREFASYVLRQNDIPVFFDAKESMDRHPLSVFLKAVIQIKLKNWRYEDVMQCLRTGLFVPEPHPSLDEDDHVLSMTQEERERKRSLKWREQVDHMDNVILENGYEGRHFYKVSWSYDPITDRELGRNENEIIKTLEDANALRRFLFERLDALFKKMDEADTTVQALHELFLFLEESGVSKQLMAWSESAARRDDVEESKRHEQLWSTFCKLADEYVLIMGREPFEWKEFFDLLKTGFEHATYRLIPPTLDQVVFSSFHDKRNRARKICFLIGLTQGNFPSVYENNDMLTEEEKELLQDAVGELHPIPKRSNLETQNEAFLAYLAFLSATEHCYLMYPENSMDKNASQLSAYVRLLQERFSLEIEDLSGEADLTNEEQLLPFLGREDYALSQYMKQRSYSSDEEPERSMIWDELADRLFRSTSNRKRLQRLRSSFAYSNQVEDLGKELAEALYGQNLYLSVSRIETYYKDPFAHFLRYALRLKERPEFELDAAGIGQYFHQSMEMFVRHMITSGLRPDQLSEEALEVLMDSLMRKLDEDPQYKVLESNERMKHNKHKLQKTAKHMMRTMQAQSKATRLASIATERSFGFHKEGGDVLQSPALPLENGGSLQLRGVIDRIDTISVGNKKYAVVVDYKSSDYKFDFSKFAAGIQLQLLTYLNIVLDNGDALQEGDWFPGAALYMQIKDAYYKQSNENIEEEALSKEEHAFQGLLIDDVEVLQTMEQTEGGKKNYLPFKLKKDGDTDSTSCIVSDEELDLMMRYNTYLILNAANRIVSGRIRMEPYEGERFVPSTTVYQAVSLFDVTLKGNSYRSKVKLNHKQTFADVKRAYIKMIRDFFQTQETEQGEVKTNADSPTTEG